MFLNFLFIILFLFPSVSFAKDPKLTHEELNARITCLRSQISNLLHQSDRSPIWAQIRQLINENFSSSAFINSENPGAVDISTPFAVVMSNADFGSWEDDQGRVPKAAGNTGMNVSLLVFRGDPYSLTLNEIPAQNIVGSYSLDETQGTLTRGKVARTNEISLANIYDEFDDQNFATWEKEKYVRQDHKPNSTQFVIIANGQPVARIQVQISVDHSIELNYEEDFRDTPKQDPPGVRRAESGRNNVLRASKRTAEAQKVILDGGGDEHLKNLLFQKVLSWINADAQLPRVRFQVTGAVRRNWMRTFSPIKFDQEILLRDDPSPAKKEWLITFSRESMLKIEERSIAKGLLDNLKKIQADPAFFETQYGRHAGEYATANFYLRANEIAGFERLGIGTFGSLVKRDGPKNVHVGTVNQYGTFVLSETDSAPVGNVHIYRKSIPALISRLETFLASEH